LVLARHYLAFAASSIEDMSALAGDKGFDVVVLCHSLSSEDCELAASIARLRWPHAKIVAISVERASCWMSADRVVRRLDAPTALLEVIDRLIGQFGTDEVHQS
jgi:hypothetical protein